MNPTMNQIFFMTIFFFCALNSHGTSAAVARNFQGASFRHQGINFKYGRCTVAEYYAEANKCSKHFYNNVRIGRMKSTNCSALYAELKSCMLNAFDNCVHGSYLEKWLENANQLQAVKDNYLAFLGNEELWCKYGGLAVPTVIHDGMNCAPIFPHLAKECVALYQTAFNSNSSLSHLCREYYNAKICLFRSVIQHCSFTARPLQQMMEMLVEMQLTYQPYCHKDAQNEVATHTTLLYSNKCPEYSHADVLFVIDASNNTSDEAFASMKSTIRSVVTGLQYGMYGIRAGLVQFQDSSVVSIRMNRYQTKKNFLRGLKGTPRIRSSGDQRRLTGAALSGVAENLFNSEGGRSAGRPHHTPLCVVLTTGQSNDNRVEDAVRTLINRSSYLRANLDLRGCVAYPPYAGVNKAEPHEAVITYDWAARLFIAHRMGGAHPQKAPITFQRHQKVAVIEVGPHLRNSSSTRRKTIHCAGSSSFDQYSDDILAEICRADRAHRETPLDNAITSSRNGHGSSLLQDIHRKLARFGVTHVPLWWVPKNTTYNAGDADFDRSLETKEGSTDTSSNSTDFGLYEIEEQRY